MRSPPSAVSSTDLRGSREMSISREGRSTFSFIRSMRLVPPAMNLAVGSAAIWRTASATSLARAYWKLIMAWRPPFPSPVDAPPVYQHRARAALTVVAALLGAGKVEMIPQQVQQSEPRSNFGFGFDAVDGHPHGNLPG